MEAHKMLSQMMDILFGSMDLMSWSISEQKSGITVCSLRFQDTGAHPTQKQILSPISFKRKSESQRQRDKKRFEKFQRPFTRSQRVDTADEDVETFRGYTDNMNNSETGPVSPDHVFPESPSIDMSNQSSVSYDLQSQSSQRFSDNDIPPEVMPEMHIRTSSVGCDSTGGNSGILEEHADDTSLLPSPPLNPDPPPDEFNYNSLGATQDIISDIDDYGNETINAIMNKPAEDVSLGDVLRARRSLKSINAMLK